MSEDPNQDIVCAIDPYVTARYRKTYKTLMLFIPPEQTETGQDIPAQVISIYSDAITRLKQMIDQILEDEGVKDA
jgi:hypothetical protein